MCEAWMRIIDYMNQGMDKAGIARALGISRTMVYRHLSRLAGLGLKRFFVPRLRALGLAAYYVVATGVSRRRLQGVLSLLRPLGLVEAYISLAPSTTYIFKLLAPLDSKYSELLYSRLRRLRFQGVVDRYMLSYFTDTYLVVPRYCSGEYGYVDLGGEGVDADIYDVIITRHLLNGREGVAEISAAEKDIPEPTIRYHYFSHVVGRLLGRVYVLSRPVNAIIYVSAAGGPDVFLGKTRPSTLYVSPMIPYSVAARGVVDMVVEAYTVPEKVIEMLESRGVYDVTYYPVKLVEKYEWGLGKSVEQLHYGVVLQSRHT